MQLKKRCETDSSLLLRKRHVVGLPTLHWCSFMKVVMCPHLTLHNRTENLIYIFDHIPTDYSYSLVPLLSMCDFFPRMPFNVPLLSRLLSGLGGKLDILLYNAKNM